ncbi:protein kinase domain-containing protein [Paenibacillus sp. strain BS8-2]
MIKGTSLGQMEIIPRIGELYEGRYRVRRIIGQGGMGTVFAVEDIKLAGRILAMKVTSSAVAPIEPGVYSSEAATLMRLDHPHLPQITDYYPPSAEGAPEVLVMEYIDGHTLAQWLQYSRQAMPFGQVLRIARQLCSALIYLHEQPRPIIHRDLKPSNIMIDTNDMVKLIDFGISRYYKEGKQGDTLQLGTTGYAAPERHYGSQSDIRSDIYSLGAVLYSLAGTSAVKEMQEWNPNRAKPRMKLPETWPRAYVNILERMLEPDVRFRFQSMQEVEQALTAWQVQATDILAPNKHAKQAVDNSQHRVVVLGLSSGTGVTFLSITLALLMARRGLAVHAAEFAGEQGEWEELLPRSLQSESEQYWRLRDDGYGGRKEDVKHARSCPVEWLPASPQWVDCADKALGRLEQTFDASRHDIQIIDLSSNWDTSEAGYLIRASDHVVVIADPNVYKWQSAKWERLHKLQSENATVKQQWHWIANKHTKFGEDRTWLSMLPDWPIAIVPLLPQEKLWNIMWSGKWPTDYAQLDQKLTRSLQPLLEVLDMKARVSRS